MLTAEAAARGAGSCPHAVARTTWHLYKSLQSRGQTMAPFRPRGAWSRPGPWPWSLSLAWGSAPAPSRGQCLFQAARGRQEMMDAWGGMLLQLTPSLSSSPASSMLITALLGVAVAVSTASPGGAWCWSPSMALQKPPCWQL